MKKQREENKERAGRRRHCRKIVRASDWEVEEASAGKSTAVDRRKIGGDQWMS